MKFSYSLLKKLLPRVPGKEKLAEAISMHAFEVESVSGDTLEIKLYANRYSDAASHIGIAREVAAIFKLPFKNPAKTFVNVPSGKGFIRVRVRDGVRCPRYAARYFEVPKIGDAPAWIKKVLKSCGIKSINAVVDIMNYVMLEVGQPLHAFDYDKLWGEDERKEIIVRLASNGEPIETLDGQRFHLDAETLVIADEKQPLAIAGVKGGQHSGVDRKTKRIVVEAANFDSAGIYRTSRRLPLKTDAAIRFANGLSPALVGFGIDRATELLSAHGAMFLDSADVYARPAGEEVIEFDPEKYPLLIGVAVTPQEAVQRFLALGFGIKPIKKGKSFLVRIPSWRMDVQNFEDLAEEVIRLTGYGALPSQPPHVSLGSATEEDSIVMKEKIREVLARLQLDEVYNTSFLGEKDLYHSERRSTILKSEMVPVEVANPIADDKKYLRPNLVSLLLRNVHDNSRFYDVVKIFEVGKVFGRLGENVKERLALGIALAAKKEPRLILELKGLLDEFFKAMGLEDFSFREDGKMLRVESDHHVIARLELISLPKNWFAAIAEVDGEHLLGILMSERNFAPLSKYPAVLRDISFLVGKEVRIGDVLQIIQEANRKLIEDVDLVDEWVDERLQGKQSLTFRIVFQAEDRTLTDEEVNKEIAKITSMLQREFGAELR